MPRKLSIEAFALSSAVAITTALGPLAASAQTNAEIQAQLEALARRVEQLETENQDLRERLEETETEVADQKKSPAPPTTRSGNDKVSLEVSGHINQAVQIANDGRDTQYNVVDNAASSSRFRLKAGVQALDELKVGGLFEFDTRVNSSDAVQNDGDIQNGSGAFRVRKGEATFEGPSWGKVSLGQGDVASNSITEIDLSGVDFAGVYSSVADMLGSYQFIDKSTNDVSGIEIGDALTNFDGFSRQPRIRYDSPSFYGVTASASAITEDRYDVALRYSGEFDELGGVKVAGGGAFFFQPRKNTRNKDSRTDTQAFAGSFSVQHSTGVNFTAAGGLQSNDLREGDDASYFYVKPGYRTGEIFDIGETRFGVDYGRYSNVANGTEKGRANTVGFGAVQTIDAASTELYAVGRWYNYDEKDRNFKDAWVGMTGARVKF